MNQPVMPGRREFFLKMGGGIVMILAADAPAFAQQRRPYPEDLNAYLVIARDGRITVFSGKVEMGQGILTSQAQMVAEELDVDLDRIDMVLGDTDRCPWDMGTFGSLTTRMFGPALRAAAAQARLTLLDLAAHKLDVTPDRLQVSNGVISVSGDAARKVSYAELSQGARIAHVVPQKAVLRAAKDFKRMGQSPRRLDAVEKVTGGAKYTADMRLPGMLYARILRPPAHGAKLIEADTRAAEALPGVTVVRESELIAVLHADPEAASKALARVRARWENPPTTKQTPENIFDHILAAKGEPRVIQERGDPGAAKPAKPLSAEYRKGYVAHAPIEPHAALAEMHDGKLTVWASTQTPFPVQEQIAQRLKLDPKQVRVRVPYIGGGFGGKSASEQAIEAAVLAVRTGKPVQVARTREEEFFLDTFDPACVVQIASGLDAQGHISHWDYTVHAAGERGAELLYDVADVRMRSVGRGYYESTAAADSVHPFAIGPWRAPGANMNIFAIESHIDTLAALAGSDPLEFRLQHMRNPRMRRVLQAAASAFGWKAAAAPSRRGFGIACGMDAGTCVAVCAHVSVDVESGEIRVRRLVCAQDMGIVVNPEGAKMQIEGCLTMGLGYALSEELRFAGGRVLDRNFDSYPLPRFRGLPKIESVLIEDDTIAPQGGGEPGIVCTGAVIANAVFDASGARLLQLPMKPERVRAALAALASA